MNQHSLQKLCIIANATTISMVVLLSSSGCRTRQFNTESKPKLSNGAEAAPGQFPSTVFLYMHDGRGCTAAKIAPRAFLTAAHCFSDFLSGDIAFPFVDGPLKTKIGVVSSPQIPESYSATSLKLDIERVFIHPTWHARAEEVLKNMSAFWRAQDVPDVAIVTVAADTPHIPVVNVERNSIKDGTEVVMMGYGCSAGVLTPTGGPRPFGTLRYGPSQITDESVLQHEDSPIKEPTKVRGSYLLTRGPQLGAGLPGLCPGDSGGPLYTRDLRSVVGVNANYTFLSPTKDPEKYPVTNWFTRLDTQSTHAVGAWIDSVLSGKETPNPSSATNMLYSKASAIEVGGPAVHFPAPERGARKVFVFANKEGEKTKFRAAVRGPEGIAFGEAFYRSSPFLKTLVPASGSATLEWTHGGGGGWTFLVLENRAAPEGADVSVSLEGFLEKDSPFTGRCAQTPSGPGLCVDFSFEAGAKATAKQVCEQFKAPVEEAKKCAPPAGARGCRSGTETNGLVVWYVGFPANIVESNCPAPSVVLEAK